MVRSFNAAHSCTVRCTEYIRCTVYSRIFDACCTFHPHIACILASYGVPVDSVHRIIRVYSVLSEAKAPYGATMTLPCCSHAGQIWCSLSSSGRTFNQVIWCLIADIPERSWSLIGCLVPICMPQELIFKPWTFIDTVVHDSGLQSMSPECTNGSTYIPKDRHETCRTYQQTHLPLHEAYWWYAEP